MTTGSNECPCDWQAICAAGTLNVQVSCTACVSGMTSHAWTTCDLFRTGGGAPGDACDPATFGACSDGEGCCNHYSCDPSTGTVRFQEPDCASACVPHMDRCPGTSPPGSPTNGLCRSADDCATAPICLPPGGTLPDDCLPCQPARHDCNTNADCAPRSVCASIARDCTCMNEPSMVCVPSCADGSAPCDAGETCGASGLCVPTPCNAGYTCGVNTSCQVGSPQADDHGCVRKTCTMDADCDCGACVGGACYDGPGVCTFL